MGRRIGVLLVLGWAIGVAAFVVTSPARAAEPPDRLAATEMLVLVNLERTSAGLPPLLPSLLATEVAEAWSQGMADTDTLAHNDAWFSQASRERVGAGAVGENVATNIDVADAHRRLMASPGHRANILDPRFDHVGIGVVRGPRGTWWITQDFFQLRSVPQVVSPPPAPAAPAPPSHPPASAPAAAPAPGPSPLPTPAVPQQAAAPVPEPRELPAADPPADVVLAAAVRDVDVTTASSPLDEGADRGTSRHLPFVIVATAFVLLVVNTLRLAGLHRR